MGEALAAATREFQAAMAIPYASWLVWLAAAGRRIGARRLYPEVKLLHSGKMRQINARTNARPTRRTNGTHIVMRKRIGIQREPIAHEWQAIRKIEGAKARPGIVSRRRLTSLARCCFWMQRSS